MIDPTVPNEAIYTKDGRMRKEVKSYLKEKYGKTNKLIKGL